MAEPPAANVSRDGGGQSVGDLVAQAVRDASRLVRCELDLAKLELRADAKRLGMASALTAVSAFTCCLVLMLLCFSLAYGLNALGIYLWASFLIVAGICVLLIGAAVGVVTLKVRRVSGLRQTRESVQEDLAMLRREEEHPAVTAQAKTG